MNPSTTAFHSEILSRLATVRRKGDIAAIVHGVLRCCLATAVGFLIALLLEQIFYLDVLPRTIIFWLLVSLSAALLVWLVLRPLLRLFTILPHESDDLTARTVGRKFPSINDHLVNILQLYPEHGGKFYSSELIDASFNDVRKDIEPLDFASAVGFAGSRRLSRILAITVGIGLFLFVVFPAPFFGSAHRLFNYGQSFAAPVPFRLFVEPGDKEVVRGTSVPILVRVEGARQQQVILSSRPDGQVEYESAKLDVTSEGTFVCEFSNLRATTRYFASAGSMRSNEYTLSVLDRPVVRTLRLQLIFPSYSRLPARQLDDNVGDVSALRGTRVVFALETNKELGSAKIVLSDSSEIPLRFLDRTATGSLVLLKERTYHFTLSDRSGVYNTDPIEYTMKIVPDAYPAALLVVPGMNLDITENQKLNLLVKITDDYGFSQLRLAYKLVQSRYEKPAQEFSYATIPLPAGIQTEGTVAYLWSLAGLSLVPEDVVQYYVEVFDNDNVSGPKSAVSETYSLRLPSLEEVFAEVDKSHDASIEGMKEAKTQAQEARRELENLQQQLKKNQQTVDWQDQKKAEALAKKYQDIQKKLDEVNKLVEQTVNEMQKNQVLSQETLEKYQELQQLMEQMNSPEFAEAMKRLQQAMQQVDPEQLRQALQQFSFSEENFRKSIERTMNLLKRIQIEQKVDEAIKRAEALLKQQEDLQKQTERTSPFDQEETNDLVKQQKDLKDQLDNLQKQLADLQSKMEEFPTEMPLEEMEKAVNQLEQGQLQQDMQQSAQQIQQGQLQQASQGQKQAAQKMGQFIQQLQQMQQAMRQNQQRQIVNEMRKALQDLLELSRREEALKNDSQRMEPNSQQFREKAAEQMEVLQDLSNVTNNLSKLSQKTFGITPEMGKSIGNAMRQMGGAMQSLDQRNGNGTAQQQAAAMGSLNEAAQHVQSAMEAMMQGGGQGMGMAGFMQRLQQLSGMQQGINQGTQGLGGLTPQQAAEMGRLAGEQGMVRKSLEQLSKEAAAAGQLSKMLGDLNSIAQEMREVQTDLAQGNINPETLRKQERILSRLLDSQRSARERDYEKKRKAESGRDVTRRTPGQIDLSTQEGRNRLRQDLLKSMEEGYARDYQELIKKYFEALDQQDQHQ